MVDRGDMSQFNVPQERIKQLFIIVAAVCVVVWLRLVYIQILRHDYYQEAAERNRTQVISQTAPRGRMLTRDGATIAASQPSFALIFLPGRHKDSAYLTRLSEDFAPRLGAQPSDLLDTLQESFDSGSAIHLADNLSTKSMFAFAELRTFYPGIDLVVETKRYYPYGNFASHLIGYMGKVDPRDWQKLRKENPNMSMNANVGRAGLEKRYEKEMRGENGGLYLEVDYRGKLKRILHREPWRAGGDLRLTLDFEAQKAAEEGLKESISKKGAVVAIDPQNGNILAFASMPDFDPNMFVSYSDSVTVKGSFKALPEYNLAIQGLYAPGSVFKIITSAALLESGRITPEDAVFCPGYFATKDRVFKCWEKRGHGRVNYLDAMTHSCDVYFYVMGDRVGATHIERMEREFGLGKKTGIDLPGEMSGHIFGPRDRLRNRGYWFQGDTLNLAIGQGELLVTPIQMAQLIASVAAGGRMYRPQFVDRLVGSDDKVLFQSKPELVRTAKLTPETWQLLRRGLKNVVDNGTGKACAINGLDVFGKTGTAQTHGNDNAWFVAFAEEPGKESRVAVAVLVQHGLHGASAAAPIARKVIEAALRWKGGHPAGSEQSEEELPVRPAPVKAPAPAAIPARSSAPVSGETL